jgi:hypothetical protein
VNTKAACKKSVAVSVLGNIVFITTDCNQLAGSTVIPYVEVFFCVAYNNLLTCSSARSMNAHNLAHWNCEQSVWVSCAKVILAGEWDFIKVIESLNIIRSNASFFAALSVIFNILINMAEILSQSLALKLTKLLQRHTF